MDWMRDKVYPLRGPIIVVIFCGLLSWLGPLARAADDYQAGSAMIDIAPRKMPVWVNGGISANKVDTVRDPLRARALVIQSGSKRVAIVVVDSCAMLVDLLDRAKVLIQQRTGIPPEAVAISATHTHSAPSVAGLHGTPVQEDYAAELPLWIADAVATANSRLEPAELGWTSTECHEFIYNRRWRMKPGTATNVLFTGRTDNIVQMNPGFDNPNKIEQVGPVDPLIPILSVRSRAGKQLAVLASFATHYAGSPALSSDYFGVVCTRLAEKLRSDEPDRMIGLMANATSGDTNCVDFSKPRRPFTHYEVGAVVADKILAALPGVQYHSQGALDYVMERSQMAVRMPSEQEVREARKYIADRMPDRLPKNSEENYARETVLLSEMPATRDFVVQALRIGDLAIAVNPCETYTETGLKLRAACKLPLLMNIGLANGYLGYIPPPRHFELGGYTTWRARSSCLEIGAEEKMVASLTTLLNRVAAGPKPTDQSNASGVRDRALSPADSTAQIVLDPDYHLQLIAAEPEVASPVDAAVDDRGRLWVVEMIDYPYPPKDQQVPRGRIRILSDSDHDGRFDRAHIFADHLNMPTGLGLWRDGALVTLGGQLVWMRDTNDDGVSDQQQVWLEGFAQQNEQLRANHPRWEWDGYWYVASGLRGGKIQLGEALRGGKAAQAFDLGTRDVRLLPGAGTAEAITGPAQFGLTSDLVGTRMFCSNRNPCVQVIFEQSHLNGNPLAGIVPATLDVLPSGEASRVHALVDAWTTSNLHAGQFTAACGVHFQPVSASGSSTAATGDSESATMPRGDVFACEPTGSLVHRRSVTHRGSVWAAEPQVESDASVSREWLASRDPWFRPVNVVAAPGGGVLVIDMHRAVIEHPAWVPEELKQRSDERYGEQAGRIYWVARRTAAWPSTVWQDLQQRPLAKRSSPELVDLLQQDDAWLRRNVGRLLVERHASEVVPQLKALFEASKSHSVEARLVALHLIGLLDAEANSYFLSAAGDAQSLVQIAALRGLSRLGVKATQAGTGAVHQSSGSAAQLALKMAGATADPWVRLEAVLCAAACVESLQDDAAREAAVQLGHLAAKDPHDPYLLVAAAGVSRAHANRLLASWLEGLSRVAAANDVGRVGVSPARDKWLISAAKQLAGRIDSATDQDVIAASQDALLGGQPTSDVAQLVAFTVLAQQIRRQPSGSPPTGKSSSGKPQERRRDADAQTQAALSPALWERARELAQSPQVAMGVRLAAVELLGTSQAKEDAELLNAYATDANDSSLRVAALKAWAAQGSVACDQYLVEQMGQASPTLRPALLELLQAKPERLQGVLRALEDGVLSAKQLGAVDLKRLVDRAPPELKGPLGKYLDSLVNTNRAVVLTQYQACTSLSGDVQRGRQVFAKNCAACHRIADLGVQVGPDISDSRVHTADKLLTAILDPNRAIDNNYFRFVAVTSDGRTVDGLIAEETADKVVLRSQNDQRHVLARSEIEQLKPTGVSMMPEGLESQIDLQAMADLISFIKNWRYDNQAIPSGIKAGK